LVQQQHQLQHQSSVQPLPPEPLLRVLMAPGHRPELVFVSNNTSTGAQLRDQNHFDDTQQALTFVASCHCDTSKSSRRSPPISQAPSGTAPSTKLYVLTRSLPAACLRQALA
jgi:hypothetical protein